MIKLRRFDFCMIAGACIDFGLYWGHWECWLAGVSAVVITLFSVRPIPTKQTRKEYHR